MIDIDTADTVFHKKSRETWLVRYVKGKYLSWCGWPPGEALLSDCLLVEKATSEERAKLIAKLNKVQP